MATKITTGILSSAAQASLRDRSTHTGTQAISSVSGLQTALDLTVSKTEFSAALADGGQVRKAKWVELAAVTTEPDGRIGVSLETTGTHASLAGDVGGASGQTPNGGEFRYTPGTGWVRIGDLQSQLAEASAGRSEAAATRFETGLVGQRQLFDQSRVTTGVYVRSTDGALIASAANNASPLIPVTAGKFYSFTHADQGVWRTKAGGYISGVTSSIFSPIQAPTNAAFFQGTVSNTNLTAYQFEQGKVRTPYQMYSEGLRSTQFLPRSIPKEALDAFGPKKNMIDPSRLVAGRAVVTSTGSAMSVAQAGFTLMLPVEAEPGATYYATRPLQWASYDADGGFLFGGTRASSGTFTVHANAALLAASWTDANLADSAQIEKGTTGTAYEPFTLVLKSSLAPDIDPTKIPKGAIASDQTGFLTPAKNLFNPADSDAATGRYIINSTGVSSGNVTYNCTGFIKVEGGKWYTQTPSSGQQHHAWFDANKAWLDTSGNVATLRAPDGAVFWRGSYDTTLAGSFQFEEGRAASNFEPYRLSAPPVLEKEQVGAVLLPRKYHVLRGSNADREQFNIYPSNAIRGLRTDWVADFDGAFGKHLNECWRLEAGNTGGTEGSGTFYNVAADTPFTLGLALRTTSSRTIALATTSVIAIDKTANTGTQIRLHGIGDSLTDWSTPATGVDRGVNYLQQLTVKLTNARLQGLRHYSTDHAELNRDGRPGWTLEQYVSNVAGTGFFAQTNGRDSPFLFPNGISGQNYRGNTAFWKGVVTNATATDFNGFQKIARGWVDSGPFLYDANGYPTAPTAGWTVYDPAQAAGARFREWNGSTWAAAVTQPVAWSFDYGKFLARFPEAFADGTPTHVSILLGANDFQINTVRPFNLASWKANLDTFISSVRAALPTAKIIICLPPLGSDQDAWGETYGPGQTAVRYKENIQALWQFILTTYDTAAQEAGGVLVCPVGLNVDPVNSFSKGADVNPNIYATTVTIKRTQQVMWVHPNSFGQQQMGDPLAALVQATRS